MLPVSHSHTMQNATKKSSGFKSTEAPPATEPRERPQRAAAQLAAAALAQGAHAANAGASQPGSPAAAVQTPRQLLAAALSSADKSLQKRQRQIIRSHKKAAAAAVAALSGVPVLHGVDSLSNFSFYPQQLEWCAELGLAPRPDWFRAVWSDGSKPSWVHVDHLGGYSDLMVTQCMRKYAATIKQQAEEAAKSITKQEATPPAVAAAAAEAASSSPAEAEPSKKARNDSPPTEAAHASASAAAATASPDPLMRDVLCQATPLSTVPVPSVRGKRKESPSAAAAHDSKAESAAAKPIATKRQRSQRSSHPPHAAASTGAVAHPDPLVRSLSRQATMLIVPPQASATAPSARSHSAFLYESRDAQPAPTPVARTATSAQAQR